MKAFIRRLLWRVLGPAPAEAFNRADTLVDHAAWFVIGNQMAGDYFEFGSFRGASLVAAYRAMQRVVHEATSDAMVAAGHCSERERVETRARWARTRFIAFDSFMGLPPAEPDARAPLFQPGRYACSEAEFQANVAGAGVPRERLITVPGWFQETCTPATADRLALRSAAIVHVDCDTYESTRAVLPFLGLLIQPGTVLLFDDWYHYRGDPNAGEQRAFREWQATMKGWTFIPFRKEGAFRRSFIAAPR